MRQQPGLVSWMIVHARQSWMSCHLQETNKLKAFITFDKIWGSSDKLFSVAFDKTCVRTIWSSISALWYLIKWTANIKQGNNYSNIPSKVTQFQLSNLPMLSACSTILWMHIDDVMKPLKCMCVSLLSTQEVTLSYSYVQLFCFPCDYQPPACIHNATHTCLPWTNIIVKWLTVVKDNTGLASFFCTCYLRGRGGQNYSLLTPRVQVLILLNI